MKTQKTASIVVAFFLYIIFAHAQSDQVATTNQIQSSGNLKGFMSHTMIVTPGRSTIEKIKSASLKMKPLRSVQSTNAGPQTIEDAADFLSKHVSMASPPAVCAEYDGVFYFSGGTSLNQDTNYLSGFAIKKGETTIHSWNNEVK